MSASLSLVVSSVTFLSLLLSRRGHFICIQSARMSQTKGESLPPRKMMCEYLQSPRTIRECLQLINCMENIQQRRETHQRNLWSCRVKCVSSLSTHTHTHLNLFIPAGGGGGGGATLSGSCVPCRLSAPHSCNNIWSCVCQTAHR